MCSIFTSKDNSWDSKLHSFVPINTSTLGLRRYSGSEESRFVTTAQQKIFKELELGAIRGYVAVEYDGMWRLSHHFGVECQFLKCS